MKFQKKAMLLLLLTSMLYTAPAYAGTTPQTPVTAVYLDDQQLQLEAQPLLVNDTVLVPMRKLFEAQGAKITWNNDTKTVKATKGDLVLTYHIGDQAANKNGHSLSVAVPGQIAAWLYDDATAFCQRSFGQHCEVGYCYSCCSYLLGSGLRYDNSIWC